MNHPAHYGGDSTYETIKVLEAWMTSEEFFGFLKGNAIKYMSRHREKGGVEDLQKALWYSNRMDEFCKRTGYTAQSAKQTNVCPPRPDIHVEWFRAFFMIWGAEPLNLSQSHLIHDAISQWLDPVDSAVSIRAEGHIRDIAKWSLTT